MAGLLLRIGLDDQEVESCFAATGMFGCANCCINDEDDDEDVGRTPTDDAVGSAVVLLSIGAIRGVVSTPAR